MGKPYEPRGPAANIVKAISTVGLYAMLAVSNGACAGSEAVPTSADISELLAEAAGTKTVSRRGDGEARRAARQAFRTMLYFDSIHESEVGSRFRRPQLRSYMMLDESFVGGEFPGSIATLLREVQAANHEYLTGLRSFPDVLERRLAATTLSAEQRRALIDDMTTAYAARRQRAVDVVTALDAYFGAAAELYELAARYPRSIRAMRTGIEIDDDAVLQRFNRLLARVDQAHAAADSAMRRLDDPAEQTRFSKMNLTKRITK